MANKHPCIECKKEVKGKSISCCICNRWAHGDCVGAETYNLVVAMNTRSGFHCWSCEGCTLAYKQLSNVCAANTKKINELEQAMTKLTADVEDSKKDNKLTNNRVDSLEAEIRNQNSSQQQSEDRISANVLSEITEREIKKSNIILHGIQEPDINLSNDEKKEFDKEKVADILKQIDCDTIIKEIKMVTRLGKKADQNSNRPLLVGLKNVTCSQKILENAKLLANVDSAKNISIVPDLTKKQREADAKVREEAKTLNNNMDDDEAKNWLWRAVGQRGQLKLAKTRRKEDNVQSQGVPAKTRTTSQKRKKDNPDQMEEMEPPRKH